VSKPPPVPKGKEPTGGKSRPQARRQGAAETAHRQGKARPAATAAEGEVSMKRIVQPPPFEPERLYTRGEIAALFGVTRITVSRWHARGYMDPAIIRTPGGGFRYRAAWIDAWREGRIP
jgi:hypothetical protein